MRVRQNDDLQSVLSKLCPENVKRRSVAIVLFTEGASESKDYKYER